MVPAAPTLVTVTGAAAFISIPSLSFAAGFGAVTVTRLVDVQAAGNLSVEVIVLRMEVVVVRKRSW